MHGMQEQMQRLSEALQSMEQALAQLDAEHRSLQRSSAADIERLTERVEDLSRTCERLQVRISPLTFGPSPHWQSAVLGPCT